MGSAAYPVQQKGIYHNLPTFDPSITGLTAIVTGANGISGFHTMRVLLESPERWTKVYALSRRPPPKEMMGLLTESQRSRVQHVAADFLEDPQKIADAMSSVGVTADYIFFYSYLQPKPPPGDAVWSNVDELVKVNSALLNNFLKALSISKIIPKRFLLQTGAKNYGIHIGRCRAPAIESDPQPSHLEPNFYYHQEKLLFEWCRANQTKWNVVMPAWILGAVNNAQMNAILPYAYYAAVQAQKGEQLHFPGDFTAWTFEQHHSSAMLTGYLSEWIVLEDKCGDERFNSQDTGPVTWDRFYHELVRWFGVEKGVAPPEDDPSKFQVIEGKPAKDTPMGYGPRTKHHVRFSLVEWASQPENKQAWEQLMAASGGQLTDNPFEDVVANFSFGDAALIHLNSLNMNKARRLGWTGFVDTMECLFEMYSEISRLGMVPTLKVDKANPLV